MGIFKDGAEVYTIGSFVCDDDDGNQWVPPCGCPVVGGGGIGFQWTNIVKGNRLAIAECPECGATWDDE